MKEYLKSIIEVLSRDANQLEHHAQKLRRISPNLSVDLKSDAELIDDSAASIRKQVGLLEHLGIASIARRQETARRLFIGRKHA